MIENNIYEGNCLDVIKTFPDKSIDSVITSPPYWQLRDYNWDGQWGLEPTFQMYLENLWSLMDEIYRVLKDTGTVWINLGDSYYGSGHGSWSKYDNGDITHKDKYYGDGRNASPKTDWDYSKMKPKTLILIPHRFAIGCIDRGWIMRNDIVWAKRNGMPESVTDRFSKKHEYFFFMTKKEKYYFDLDGIRDKHKTNENRPDGIVRNRLYDYNSKANDPTLNPFAKNGSGIKFGGKKGDGNEGGIYSGNEWFPRTDGKNPGSVSDFWDNKNQSFEEYMKECEQYYYSECDFWDIPTQPSSDAHYATYNTKLIDKPIVAGCPIGGIILDPFAGTATTGCRAIELQRKFIGIEGSEKFVKIGNKKLAPYIQQKQLF